MRKFIFSIALFVLFSFSFQAQVNINETVYDPPTGSNDGGSMAGEWIELFGTAGTDISCYVLTDGDWTITIPNGTTIPGDGYYTIGKAAYANTPGAVNGSTPVDLDVESCGSCTTGSNVMELTNSGEFIGLYDGGATPVGFIDGVIYESPSAGNLPSGESPINTAAITGCPSVTVDLAASHSSYTSVGSGGNSAIGRADDGTGTWGYLAPLDTSPNATNNAALPVKMTAFELSRLNDNVELKWTTESEENNDYFEIQHSEDGKEFFRIGNINGNGASSTIQRYQFIHENPINGLNYYRLKQVDFNEQFEYSDVESIIVFDGSTLQIFPTIVKSTVTIVGGKVFGKNAIYEVYNISGQKIQNGILPEDASEMILDTSSWHQGHYVIQVLQNGNRNTFRIIK